MRIDLDRALDVLRHRRDLRPHRVPDARDHIRAHACDSFDDDVDPPPPFAICRTMRPCLLWQSSGVGSSSSFP